MAVVSTLWSVALLAAIALSLSFTGMVSYRIANNDIQIASEEALTEAALNRTVLALLDPRSDKRWPVNGVTQQFVFGGATIQVRIQDELGKIDLNQTDGSILIQLFQSAGLDVTAAGALADKVLDWRDKGPLKRLNGAKSDDYRAAGYDYLPRNGPFQSVDELMLVMDMSHDLYQRIAPALTVYSAKQFIDPRFAPREVLLALSSAGDFSVAPSERHSDALTPGTFGEPIAALKGRAFRVDIQFSGAIGDRRNQSVIRLTGNPDEPFWILNWQRS